MVFSVACGCSALATLYVIFLVPETVRRTDTQSSCCKLFDIFLVRDMFVACLKKRDGLNRAILWSCIIGLSLNLIAINGDSAIGFLFASAKFGWNVSDYSLSQAASVLFIGIGTLLAAKLFRVFLDEDMMDMRIAKASIISAFACSVTRSLATRPWHLYLAIALASLSGLLGPVLRAVLSKSGPSQDAGKIFTLSQSIEAIIPLIASPVYTLVYTHNMPPIYPSPVYFVTAATFLALFVIVILIDRELKDLKNFAYVSIKEDFD